MNHEIFYFTNFSINPCIDYWAKFLKTYDKLEIK